MALSGCLSALDRAAAPFSRPFSIRRANCQRSPLRFPGICLFCIGAFLSSTVAQTVLCEKEPVMRYLNCNYTCSSYKKQKILCETDGQSPILCHDDAKCSGSKCKFIKCSGLITPLCQMPSEVPLCVIDNGEDSRVKRTNHTLYTRVPRKFAVEFRFERFRSLLIGLAILMVLPLGLFFVHWFIHSDHPLTRYVIRYNEERHRLGLSRESGYSATRISPTDSRDPFTRTAYHDECYPGDHQRHGHTIRHNRSQSERRTSRSHHGSHRHHNSASNLSRQNANSTSSNRHHHRIRSSHSCRHYRRSPEHVVRNNLGRENEGYSASNPTVNYGNCNERPLSWTLGVPTNETTDRRHSSPRLEGHRVHWYAGDNDPFAMLILDSDERLNNNRNVTYGTVSPNRRNYARITNNPLHVPSEIRVDLPPSYSETMGMDEPPPTYGEVMANYQLIH